MRYNKKSIGIHSLAWVVVLLLMMFMASRNGVITYGLVVLFLYFGSLNILIFYINYVGLVPMLLARKRYGLYLLGVVALVMVMGLVKFGMAVYFKEYMMDAKNITFVLYYTRTLMVSMFFVFFSCAINFTVDWFLNEKARKNFETEKLSAELSFLRSQINPHFLLNSLNTIYSLAYQRSDKTPEAVLKLSDIMKYMLYESNDTKVELSKEVRYIENYIELQRIRSKDNAAINLRVEIDSESEQIVPLILIPFIENAFKHGVINDLAHPVEILVRVNRGKLTFRVSNALGQLNKDETGGIGLQNVRRRLELLYPGRYSLKIDEQDAIYSCELLLDL